MDNTGKEGEMFIANGWCLFGRFTIERGARNSAAFFAHLIFLNA